MGNCSRFTLDKMTVADSVLIGHDMVNYANEYFVNIANRLTQNMRNFDQVTFFM